MTCAAGLTALAAVDSLIHMKRTNLVLDEKLLEEATRLSAQRTYSATVDFALAELVRRARAGQILGLAGSGLWEGDLTAMRRDAPARRRTRRTKHAAR
jgi:Arc/MetJ family transcription regulator